MTNPTPSAKARYIMIGGFLGAGKTTAVAALAQRLSQQGLRVGLITNDQGSELVDTAMLRARGFATEEIPGGCFCCRFNSLVDAASRLTADTRPDVFIAEPVGSCTDLVATVTYPLRRLYGSDFTIAPLSVLIDPVRAEQLFGLALTGRKFSEKVLYIYRKQLEEADLLVISKSDSMQPERLAALRERLASEFPAKEILQASVHRGDGLEEWFSSLTEREQQTHRAMEVDYQTYADGEALLGWLNATIHLSSNAEFDAGEVLKTLARAVCEGLGDAEIAHLKMTLSPDSGLSDIAVVNLVRNDYVPELSQELEAPIQGGQLIVNCRAEADPDSIKTALQSAINSLEAAFPALNAKLEHLEHFRPGKPEPTHRDTPAAV